MTEPSRSTGNGAEPVRRKVNALAPSSVVGGQEIRDGKIVPVVGDWGLSTLMNDGAGRGWGRTTSMQGYKRNDDRDPVLYRRARATSLTVTYHRPTVRPRDQLRVRRRKNILKLALLANFLVTKRTTACVAKNRHKNKPRSDTLSLRLAPTLLTGWLPSSYATGGTCSAPPFLEIPTNHLVFEERFG